MRLFLFCLLLASHWLHRAHTRYTHSAQVSVAEHTASHTTITVLSHHAIELNAALKRAIQLKIEGNAAATAGDEMLIEDIRELLHLSFEAFLTCA